MDCKKVKQSLFLFCDEEMETAQQDLFKQHLSRCPHCAQHFRYTEKFLVLVRRRCGRMMAPRELRIRIQMRLSNESGGMQTFH